EVYRSSEMGQHSPAEFIHIPVAGVKELRLIADNVDGNGLGDFTSWGDAQFITTNSKPTLEVESNAVYHVGSELDVATLVGTYQAQDVEDGDLTSAVQITGLEAIRSTKPGNYEIVYTVTDSQGNTTTQVRTIDIVDLADFDYVSDHDWAKATQSFSSTQKDQHYSGSKLRLSDETGAEVTYERGLGTHANAEIVYDLTQSEAVLFSTYVGIDRAMYNSSAASVIFEFYVDGEKVAATDVMYGKTPQQYIEFSIAGAKELKLVVNNAGNGNGSDHGTFGDAKFHYVNVDRADVTQLQQLVAEVEAMDFSGYTPETVAVVTQQLQAAKALLASGNVMQTEADDMSEKLTQAVAQLVSTNHEVNIPDATLNRV
ncbi:MAG: NPCBM/NEW2 domain-containing protein, partial [Culicoidibacterales bacterium]